MSQCTPKEVPYRARLLARNTVYNIMGRILPMAVALAAIPCIVKGLGVERFGVLTLAWMVIGYFSLFDMGIGRATTKFVAEYTARGNRQRLRALVLASMILLLGFGTVAGLLLASLTDWIVADLLNIPADLIEETSHAFYLLSVSVPFVLLAAGARGVLEAQQQFGIVNAIQIPSGVGVFAVPVLVLTTSNSLPLIVGILVGCRIVVLMVYLYLCWKSLRPLNEGWSLEKGCFGVLLRFGGWLTISNVLAPLMGNMDRFFIGSILTMTAVAYYTAAFDIVTRLFVIPAGMLGVMFPVFSAYNAREKEKLARLHQRTVKYILICMTPLVLGAIVFAKPFLKVWLGDEFAAHGTLVLQLLAAGVLFSSAARVPLNAIQAVGRPDLTAKLYLIELPVYLALLFFFTKALGIAGAALVWLTRLIIETVILFALIRPMAPFSTLNLVKVDRTMYVWITATVTTGFVFSLIPSLYLRSVVLVAAVGLAVYLAFFVLLDGYEKSQVRQGWLRVSRNWNKT